MSNKGPNAGTIAAVASMIRQTTHTMQTANTVAQMTRNHAESNDYDKQMFASHMSEAAVKLKEANALFEQAKGLLK